MSTNTNFNSFSNREAALETALVDMLAGWRYVRYYHGDFRGVDWNRCETAAVSALTMKTENELIESLRETLRPFAEIADKHDPPENDDWEKCWLQTPTLGDIRKARIAFNALASL